jgi:hypothetical protein
LIFIPVVLLIDHERKIFGSSSSVVITSGSTMAAPTRREPGVTIEPEIEHRFAVATQGYEPRAVHACIEELTSAREALVRRAAQLRRETEDLTRLVAARNAKSGFEAVLANLASSLGAAYAERHELRCDLESRSRQERTQAQALIRTQLQQLDEESVRATAAAEVAAGQLLEEAGRAAAEIRSAGTESAATIAAGADEVLDAARARVTQRTEEVVADLTAWQLSCEQGLTVAQARADGRLDQAIRAAAVDTDQARSVLEHAAQSASRLRGEARKTAAELLADSRVAADRLTQESERAAAEVAANLRSIGRFVDALPLPAGLLETGPRPAGATDDTVLGPLAEVMPLRSWRRVR